ncbi:Sumo-conjugating enzyme ubc9 [Thelohanellus kitauei]|uniref:Sumo-conjugating enzyme ubc9 n=1 Tax=Thelohanellus kitauei TaxID=669202 RepID=A0A0C2MY40_THEKT|nr:Sumo-conjugating enzyme ubc9 [Thelohanellus kitauei]
MAACACIPGMLTAWEGVNYPVILHFNIYYPSDPPRCKHNRRIGFFFPPVFHPNVDALNGWICLDILMSKWNPSITIYDTLRGIQQMLMSPNTKSPANPIAAYEYE